MVKILVADDHELFLKGLELILTDYRKNFKLVTAKSYTEIFEIIRKDKDFDLILTDLAMPGAYWLEALEQIHRVLPDTPVIILSAVFEKEIVKKSIDIGAAGMFPRLLPIKKSCRPLKSSWPAAFIFRKNCWTKKTTLIWIC